MFPVPSHLPRSPLATSGESSTTTPDPVLDLIDPLLKAGSSSTSNLSRTSVQAVRENIQSEISSNKKRGHDLLVENFPTVSSHIQLGSQLRVDYDTLQSTLSSLEREIDPSDSEVSFLPPVLDLLDRHFSAVQTKERAKAHVSALKALSGYTTRLQKLEDAIWAGRGADDWVVKDLKEEGVGGYDVQEGTEIFKSTKVYKLAQDRIHLFRSMVIEQISDAFGQAVSITTPKEGEIKIIVQNRTTLQQPRIPRPPRDGSPSTPSKPPPYSLSHIYDTLHAFSNLSPTLTSLKNRLLRDVVPLLADPVYQASSDISSNTSTFHLHRQESSLSPSDTLKNVSTFLDFLHSTVLARCSHAECQASWSETQKAVLQVTLDKIILPAMPATLSKVPGWLTLVQSALEIEKSQSDSEEGLIKNFFEKQAGEAWAQQRRIKVAEDVRKLIVGGWGGWEAKEAEREKEVSMVVEVEVDEPVQEQEAEALNGTNGTKEDDAFGWGFDDSPKTSTKVVPEIPQGQEDTPMEEGDGWGFEEPEAGPSSPRPNPPKEVQASADDADEGDGWDFDDTVTTPAIEPPKPILAKPAREAKRLGKKVAKVKAIQDDDPWGSGSESVTSKTASSVAPVQEDSWGWDDPEPEPVRSVAPAEKPVEVPKAKRKELREEKRVIRETFLVSRACDKLVDIAERVLKEASDVASTSLESPSFTQASSILLSSATDVFDLHRSLLPSNYAPQLRDVPTLSMQLHNDAIHLASRVKELEAAYPSWHAGDNVVVRLYGLADHAFETQISSQRDSLMESINEAEGFAVGTDEGLRKAEKAISGVVYNIDSLSRVLKVVLPTTTYFTVLGYLLDEAVYRITSDILDLSDITETESERINEILKPIRPLEEIFIVEQGQPSTVVAHVPHWLKFCYISELLQANIVDILYLFDSGALIDFTTEELVSLIRALFADSEKRDNAIERIEKGVPAAEGH